MKKGVMHVQTSHTLKSSALGVKLGSNLVTLVMSGGRLAGDITPLESANGRSMG